MDHCFIRTLSGTITDDFGVALSQAVLLQPITMVRRCLTDTFPLMCVGTGNNSTRFGTISAFAFLAIVRSSLLSHDMQPPFLDL
ncbi:hypothetical protein YH62_25050 [Rhizobium sp. LC145]|nr:hypothetical protein YH62_25050 [Rhizobium sp. LC145]